MSSVSQEASPPLTQQRDGRALLARRALFVAELLTRSLLFCQPPDWEDLRAGPEEGRPEVLQARLALSSPHPPITRTRGQEHPLMTGFQVAFSHGEIYPSQDSGILHSLAELFDFSLTFRSLKWGP